MIFSDIRYVMFDGWCNVPQYKLSQACLLASVQRAITVGPFVLSNFFLFLSETDIPFFLTLFRFLSLSIWLSGCISLSWTYSRTLYLSFSFGILHFLHSNHPFQRVLSMQLSPCTNQYLVSSLFSFSSLPSLSSLPLIFITSIVHRIISKMPGTFLTVWLFWAASLTSWLPSLG